MGYYINPEKCSKEQWLADNGQVITPAEARDFNYSGERLPVCLVSNGAFTAAGIGYCREETDAFLYPDGRPRMFFSVEKEKLKEFIPWEEMPWETKSPGELVRGRVRS